MIQTRRSEISALSCTDSRTKVQISDIELSPQVFSILSSLIEEKVGLHYGLLDRDILKDRVATRAVEKGFESLLDYYYFIRYDEAGHEELKELVESLVVNETYFFREWKTIQALVDCFIRPWCDAGKRPRIWIAACSTGEEPLSLAMLLKEKGLLSQVEIFASDISENALKKARSNRFGKRSVRQVPDMQLKEKNIFPEGDYYHVSQDLYDAIQWKKTNILHNEEYPGDQPFDVILCRNLLIYFADETIKSVLDKLWQKMTPNGMLVVGVSESLLRFGSKFNGEEHAGSFFYMKAPSHEK